MDCVNTKIPIKQGQKTRVDLYVDDESTGNLYDFSSGYTARMQVRRNEQDATVRDSLDTEGTTSKPARIILGDGVPPTGSTATEVANVVLTWDTEESEALDLNDGTVRTSYPGVGDLEILDATDEVVVSIRMNFTQVLEVTKDAS